VPTNMSPVHAPLFDKWGRGRDGISGVNLGERMMTKFIIDVVLFSCMFTFVTGIVLAAAHVLG
jgi:hypothetical protein